MRISVTILMAMGFILCGSTSAWATTWHVPGDFASLDEAIAAAQNGDTIQMAPGTYPGSFTMDKDLTVVGNPASPGEVVLQVTGFWLAAPSSMTLQGLTLSGENCQDSAAMTGGAIIEDCHFENFQFVDSFGIILMFADIQFLRCSSRNNHNEGTLFWIQSNSTVLFDGCLFEDNGGGVAGVILQFGASPLVVRNCLFQNNHSTSYAGAINGGHDLLIESCRFENNSADQKGGALFGDGNNPCIIRDSSFIGNSATQGGAIATGQVFTIQLENTDFQGNTATEAGPQGWTDVGGVIDMVCCLADPQLWAGIGQVTLINEGCTVDTSAVTWDEIRAMFR